ncbi:AmiS/UreI family transporter [Bacillus cereus group sp. MYBK71-2]|uniref:AmiS/UreI family transporter n=1 Tax=Bacillus cereus group TaxID=86661 RepID=UPI000789E873|nr:MULTISPECIES: AmiS/UreI family transporter [Bacillus cereus group]KYQ02224.1 AmiSUreI AmiS/UreI family transporter [Bacillus cereus]MCC2340101.1 AmiS/UreI family transporter [Bacillus tropicus]MCU5424648.1 AmiS/UreI family transporter [Bacillus tropicus]MDA1651687.1 AmiS/UreI family transporter [Bacillus cereus group sp. TH160LC]MDA1777993.1 AmiS/UreI family transporter [Bacillus cereus group sp. BY9-3LC]
MGYVGLLLSGAALFLNSLVILGKAEMKSAGVFNLFVGALQIIIPFYLIMISDQSNWTVYSYAATFLFGLTYLYVGVTFIKGMDSSGLGWFCIWVAIIALFYMIVSFVQFHDVVNALTWFMWALLWYLFFVLNTQKKNINQYLGRIAFVQSWITLTLPSLFYFMGVWGEGFVYELWVYVSVISILYFCYCIYKYRVR